MQSVISVLNVHHEEDCLFIANDAQYMLRQQQAGIEALKEKMCKAIYEEAAYCYDTGDYMLDYSDCQEIIRGTWVRPLYAGQEDSAILRKVNRK